jgi:hypothetical protein
MLHTAAAGAVAVGFGNYAAAATKTVKIGLVAPQTGPLAIFSEQIPWTVEQIKKATEDKITIGGTTYPLEIVLRDSQSNPNRARGRKELDPARQGRSDDLLCNAGNRQSGRRPMRAIWHSVPI